MIYRGIYQAFMSRGTRDVPSAKAFLTAISYPHVLMRCADALQISRKYYFRLLSINFAKSTSRAFAIFRQVSSFGLRFSFSIKLMVARLKPVFSASFSCDTPHFVRTLISSDTILAASFSDSLSLIQRIIRYLRPHSYVTKVREV